MPNSQSQQENSWVIGRDSAESGEGGLDHYKPIEHPDFLISFLSKGENGDEGVR